MCTTLPSKLCYFTEVYNQEKGVYNRVARAELANPFLESAIQSYSNALEAFQKRGERHRQITLIQMDQAVGYILKAIVFQLDSAEFL